MYLSATFKFPAALLLLAATLPVSASTNLVNNPGFETGSLSGWTVGGPSYGVGVDQNSSDVQSGSYGAYFGSDPTNPGLDSTLSQTLATTSGTQYTLSFWMSEYQADGLTGFFNVDLGGTQLLNLKDVAQQDFTHYSFNYIATSSNSVLLFDTNNVPGWYGLDNISVTSAVPEAPSWLFLSLGLLLLSVWSKYRPTPLSFTND
jgi:hypothetical protein